MANAFLGHEAQTFFDPFVRVRHAQIRRHDLGDFGFAGALAAKDYFARVIALGKHSDQARVFHDQERADVLVVHHFNGVVNSALRRDRKNLTAFLIEDGADMSAYVHRWRTLGVEKIEHRGPTMQAPRLFAKADAN